MIDWLINLIPHPYSAFHTSDLFRIRHSTIHVPRFSLLLLTENLTVHKTGSDTIQRGLQPN